MTQVLFHRDFQGYTGGHGKVWDYFQHVGAFPGFEPRIYFSPGSFERAGNPWRSCPELVVSDWWPEGADGLFLAGMDWAALPEGLEERIPVLNLVQGVRHARPRSSLRSYLGRRALRICVSQPVADAILATGEVNGPLHVISAGIDLVFLESLQNLGMPRAEQIFIYAAKRPELGTALAQRLADLGLPANVQTGLVERRSFLRELKTARVAVLLPLPEEGFFLPGLEAMAVGTPSVMCDAFGNRAYACSEENCLLAADNTEALTAAVLELVDERLCARFREAGRMTARRHSLDAERAAFHALLANGCKTGS